MSKRHGKNSRHHGRKPPLVLIFGESDNDRKVILELVTGLKPALSGKVQTRHEPLVLIKNARSENVPTQARRLAAVVNAARVINDVQCVFAHEDCDDVEPRHISVCEKIEGALRAEGCPVHAVVPAWTMEAWFFLWPEAVQSVSKSWRIPDDYVGRDIGKIPDAKKDFKEKIVPKGLSKQERARFRYYKESDGPTIARTVRERGWVNKPQAKSQSYDRFRQSVATCGE